jgi:hypothetical protein
VEGNHKRKFFLNYCAAMRYLGNFGLQATFELLGQNLGFCGPAHHNPSRTERGSEDETCIVTVTKGLRRWPSGYPQWMLAHSIDSGGILLSKNLCDPVDLSNNLSHNICTSQYPCLSYVYCLSTHHHLMIAPSSNTVLKTYMHHSL